MDEEMILALLEDAKKLTRLTGEDHTPVFLDSELAVIVSAQPKISQALTYSEIEPDERSRSKRNDYQGG